MGTEQEVIREAYEEASQELDTAVEQGADGQARYWLGRKQAVEDLMEKLEVGYVAQ